VDLKPALKDFNSPDSLAKRDMGESIVFRSIDSFGLKRVHVSLTDAVKIGVIANKVPGGQFDLLKQRRNPRSLSWRVSSKDATGMPGQRAPPDLSLRQTVPQASEGDI
jgi:hypothetical protein